MVQVLTHDVAAPENPVISVQTPDIDEAYAEAQQRGFEIVYPLTTEPWGVRRFFVRAPDGNVSTSYGTGSHDLDVGFASRGGSVSCDAWRGRFRDDQCGSCFAETEAIRSTASRSV